MVDLNPGLSCCEVIALTLSLSVCLSLHSDAVGVFVKHVVPGSAADQSGNIQVQDRLIAVRKLLFYYK